MNRRTHKRLVLTGYVALAALCAVPVVAAGILTVATIAEQCRPAPQPPAVVIETTDATTAIPDVGAFLILLWGLVALQALRFVVRAIRDRAASW
jgi:hypothetical protein